MVIDPKTLATVNLVVQILLLIMVLGAEYLAKKRELMRHCKFMRILVPVQIIAIATVMLPSMLGYLANPPPFSTEMLVHHALGLSVVVLWIYINLSFGKPWMPRNLALFMRSAFTLWILALLLGLHMYLLIYIGL
ncbi:MAG: hypothetical protein ABOK23_09635 [Candidatus Methanoperedens sp.]|nr:hypothetical protein [Candidatus Methanoperedens sp.]